MADTAKPSSASRSAPVKLQAVFMLRRANVVSPDGYARFDFRGTPLSAITRIEWPAIVAGTENSIALVPPQIAGVLIASNYARAATEAEEAAFNDGHFGAPVPVDGGAPLPDASEPDTGEPMTSPPHPDNGGATALHTGAPIPDAGGLSIPHPGEREPQAAPQPEPKISQVAPPAANADAKKGGKRK